MSTFLRYTRWLVGFILLWSAVSKLGNMNGFYMTISQSGLIPVPLQVPAALAVPSLELTLAIFLLLGGARQPTALCALVLFITFLAWQIITVMRGSPGGCGCFTLNGANEELLGPTFRVARGVILCVLAYLIFHWDVIVPRGAKPTETPIPQEKI
jgi:uncharacterized membrane protein YphA (DoxX/SURF4 family)